jgi:hypothetical protein
MRVWNEVKAMMEQKKGRGKLKMVIRKREEGSWTLACFI